MPRRPCRRRCGRLASTRTSTSRCRSTSTLSDEAGPDGPRSASYFGTKPVVLAFVYYDCPMLCTQVLNALDEHARRAVARRRARTSSSSWSASIRARRRRWRPRRRPSTSHRYKRPGAEPTGWHFLTGDAAVDRAADEGRRLPLRLGRADAAVRAPDRHHRPDAGRPARRGTSSASSTARAICGWRWSKRRRARSAPPVDALLLYCYHYDPMTGRYGLVVMRALRIAGARHRPRARRVHRRHAPCASADQPRHPASLRPQHLQPST